MDIIIAAGIPVVMVLVTYVFGLYTRRNIGWVLLSLAWGVASYEVFVLLQPKLLEMNLNRQWISIIYAPLIQHLIISIGIFFVIFMEKFDNLINGAIYGFAAGLGYAAHENFLGIQPYLEQSLELAGMIAFSVSLVYATASCVVGIAISQFYFRHRANRTLLLFAGLGTGIGYTALFNFLTVMKVSGYFGYFLPAVFSVGGTTLMGLYVTGLLRKILIQVGVEKKRADGLLEIVIPIGVQLSTEKDFSRLLEKMLVEAQAFCKADAGTLYLMNEDRLEFAVVRNNTLDISMGGTSGREITLPAINLHDKTTGEPNNRNVASYAALTGKTINVIDAYSTKEFDFSGVKDFDKRTGYESVSFLTIPLKNNEGTVLGVLQLLNAMDARKKIIIPFDKNLQQLMESFSALACAALEGYIQEQNLRKEIQQLRIEIDSSKQKEQVDQITETDYFRDLQRKAKDFRDTKRKDKNLPQ